MTDAPAKKRINVRTKGAVGERELKDMFIALMQRVETELGIKGCSEDVKRNTLQSDRGGFDLVGLPLIAVECKRCETVELAKWFEQAKRQATRGELPVVIYRQNRRPWMARTYVALTAEDASVLAWTVADFDGVAFFAYYEQLYRRFLLKSAS